MIRKTTGWQGRLFRYIAANQKRTFDRGTFDCLRFCNGAVQEMSGQSITHELLGTYANDLEAVRILRNLGDNGLINEAEKALVSAGCIEVAIPFAQTGDMLFYDKGETENGFAVCVGQHAMTPGQDGLRSVPTRKAARAWRILG